MWAVVKALKQRSGSLLQSGIGLEGGGKTVYLAQTTSDLQPEVEKIRRELIGRGHKVVPSQPLSMVGDNLMPQVAEYLSESTLSIHPVGKSYGIVPEGANESMVEIRPICSTGYGLSSVSCLKLFGSRRHHAQAPAG